MKHAPIKDWQANASTNHYKRAEKLQVPWLLPLWFPWKRLTVPRKRQSTSPRLTESNIKIELAEMLALYYTQAQWWEWRVLHLDRLFISLTITRHVLWTISTQSTFLTDPPTLSASYTEKQPQSLISAPQTSESLPAMAYEINLTKTFSDSTEPCKRYSIIERIQSHLFREGDEMAFSDMPRGKPDRWPANCCQQWTLAILQSTCQPPPLAQ